MLQRLMDSNKVSNLRFSLTDVLIVIAVVVYILYWSYLSIYRIITFQAGVFDLGSMSQDFYLVFHGSSPYNLLMGFLNRDIMILFSPLYFTHSLFAIVITQTIFLGATGFIIYSIAKLVLKSDALALLFGILFLFYPMMYGVNWFDVHNQAFFIFFFPLAFYLFLKERYALSAAFFLIAGMTHYLYLIFPILFSLPIIVEIIFKRDRNFFREPERLWGAIIFVGSLSLLALSYYLNSLNNLTVSTVLHSSYGPLAHFNLKLLTFFVALAPVAFVSLYPNRYVLLLLPFFFLVFSSSTYVYLFPTLLVNQYPSMLIPGLFISAIYGYSGIIKLVNEKPRKQRVEPNKLYSGTKKNTTRIVVLAMVILTSYLVISTAPYSPLNSDNGLYNTSLSEMEYSKLYAEFNNIVSLIPKNDPYVVFGDNEPEVTPLPQIQNAPMLVIPYEINGNFSYRCLSNSSIFAKAKIQYVIGNPYGVMFTLGASGAYNLSMFNALNRLYDSGNYGILAEASGMILLERNYSGRILYYVPMDINLNYSYLLAPYILGYVPYEVSSVGQLFGVEVQHVFHLSRSPELNSTHYLNGPMFLPPGSYYSNLTFTVVKEKPNASVSTEMIENNGDVISNVDVAINKTGVYSVSMPFYISGMQDYMHLIMNMKNVTVQLGGLHVEQNSQNYENSVLYRLRINTNESNVPHTSSPIVQLSLNISREVGINSSNVLNANLSNILFSLPNNKLINSFIESFNQTSKNATIVLKITPDESKLLYMLILRKSFNSYDLHGPLGAAPWVFNSSFVYDNGERVFSYFSSFWGNSLPEGFIVSKNGAPYQGQIHVDNGLIEETNGSEGINLISNSGYRPPFEISYFFNLSQGSNGFSGDDEVWISVNSPEPIQLWVGNTSYLNIVYRTANGSQVVDQLARPKGITVISFLVGFSNFTVRINGINVMEGNYGKNYENITGYWPFSLFDLNGNVISPRLLAVSLESNFIPVLEVYYGE